MNNINNLFSEVNNVNDKLYALFKIIGSQKDLVKKITNIAFDVVNLKEKVIDIIRNS